MEPSPLRRIDGYCDSLPKGGPARSPSLSVTPTPGAVRNGDHSVDGLDPFQGQFVPQWLILDAVLNQERIAAGGEPVGGWRQR
ncbi:MAG: hypothetical protein Ct9H300mP1_33240 [Planctomycetaceae bacterium]|nr:MAG: hypothetical protein Ct9H300mP1_33240 [Planctomycetaceae bacterium]